MILENLNKPKSLITPVSDRPAHDRRYSIDCGKIKKLGWRPKYKFKEALSETIHWYQTNEKWWRQIKEKEASFKNYYDQQYSDLKSQ